MLYLLIVIGLAVAGAVTGNVAFYWIAGIMAAFVFLVMILMGSMARRAFKQTKQVMDRFDNDSFFKSGRL